MPGPADLYTGAVAAEERWRSRRAENRKAFTEFMSLYPNASAEDYRAYAFEVSEGNSYLRGGLPSDQILGRLASDRQAQYAQEQVKSQLGILQAKAQLTGTLDALASQHVLDTDDDNKLLEQLAASIGYNKNDPNTHSILDQIKQQYPSGFGAIRTQQRNELFNKNLPTIKELIKANPNLKDDELLTLVPGLDPTTSGPRRGLITEMLKGARKEDQEARDKESLARIDRAVADAREQVNSTGEYTIPTLPGEEAKEVERRIKPFAEARLKLNKQADLDRVNAGLSSISASYTSNPAYMRSLVGSQEKQALYKETLRRVASSRGLTPDDNALNLMVQQAVDIGTENDRAIKEQEAKAEKLRIHNETREDAKLAASQEREDKRLATNEQKAALETYKRDLSTAAVNPLATISMLPTPPKTGDAVIDAAAVDEFKRQSVVVAERSKELAAVKEADAASRTTDALMKDEGFLSQVKRGDIPPQQISARVTRELQNVTGHAPTADAVKNVLDSLNQKVSSIASSELVLQMEATKKASLETLQATSKQNMAAVLATINANIPSREEGVVDPAANALSVAVQTMLMDPQAGRVLTASGVQAIAPYLTREFAEENNNDPGRIAMAIAEKAGNALNSSSAAAVDTQMKVKFPYGDARGSKLPLIRDRPVQVANNLAKIDAELQQSYQTLTASAGKLRMEQARHPTMAFDNSQSLEMTKAFNDKVNELQRRAQQEVAGLIQQVEMSAQTSQFWSSEGEITAEEIALTRKQMSDRLKATLANLDMIKKNGTQITMQLGMKPADALMKPEERIRQNSLPVTESIAKKFWEGPVGSFIDDANRTGKMEPDREKAFDDYLDFPNIKPQ